jgi:hypothetical protein
MEKRVAIVEVDGQKVLGVVEKHCSPSCPCEKPREKGIANPAMLTLAHLDPQCSLQRIRSQIEGLLIPQIHNRLSSLDSVDFEAYCKEQRQIHFAKADECIRFLANPGKKFLRSMLTTKLWNEQAVKVYSQALAANAIDGNIMALPSATACEPKLKNLLDILRGGFTVERLTALITYLVPDLDKLRSLPKEKQQGRGRNGEWKSAFPAVAAALEARGYLLDTVSDRVLASLFYKQFNVSISDKTFSKRRLLDEKLSDEDYLARANSWLDKERP